MAELRHAKNGRAIGNSPVCVDDFGNLIFICQYTKKPVNVVDSISLGGVIPQLVCTYVCAPDAIEAFKDAKRDFDSWDQNCNACIHFVRLPHDKETTSFVRGKCSEKVIPKKMVYRVRDSCFRLDEFWVHPDDSMNMKCWEQRPKKI